MITALDRTIAALLAVPDDLRAEWIGSDDEPLIFASDIRALMAAVVEEADAIERVTDSEQSRHSAAVVEGEAT
jgi:hypothetical protein